MVGENGEVKAGMGGKFTGKPISEAKGSGENEQKSTEQKREYTPEHRAAQKAAQEAVKALPQYAIEHHAKEHGISAEEAKKALLLEANQNSVKSAETVAKLSQVQKPAPQEMTKQAEQPKPEYKQARHISEGILEGQSRITDPKYGDSHDTSIVWENENSYGIPDPNYMGTGYYARHRWAKGENVSKSKYIFLPKSQVTIEGEGANRKIVAMADWLAKEKGLTTENNAKKEQEREATEASLQESANKRYEELIQHAKNAGIKGVRSGMRTRTILEKLQEAGVESPKEYQEGGREELAEASSETKYRDIPGKGKGVVLNVPYDDKDEAKQYGARWSPDLKKWYFPEGTELPKELKKWAQDCAMDSIYYTPDIYYTDDELANLEEYAMSGIFNTKVM